MNPTEKSPTHSEAVAAGRESASPDIASITFERFYDIQNNRTALLRNLRVAFETKLISMDAKARWQSIQTEDHLIANLLGNVYIELRKALSDKDAERSWLHFEELNRVCDRYESVLEDATHLWNAVMSAEDTDRGKRSTGQARGWKHPRWKGWWDQDWQTRHTVATAVGILTTVAVTGTAISNTASVPYLPDSRYRAVAVLIDLAIGLPIGIWFNVWIVLGIAGAVESMRDRRRERRSRAGTGRSAAPR